MTRETKLGLVVSGSFLCLLGALIAHKLLRSESPPEENQVSQAASVKADTSGAPTRGTKKVDKPADEITPTSFPQPNTLPLLQITGGEKKVNPSEPAAPNSGPTNAVVGNDKYSQPHRGGSEGPSESGVEPLPPLPSAGGSVPNVAVPPAANGKTIEEELEFQQKRKPLEDPPLQVANNTPPASPGTGELPPLPKPLPQGPDGAKDLPVPPPQSPSAEGPKSHPAGELPPPVPAVPNNKNPTSPADAKTAGKPDLPPPPPASPSVELNVPPAPPPIKPGEGKALPPVDAGTIPPPPKDLTKKEGLVPVPEKKTDVPALPPEGGQLPVPGPKKDPMNIPPIQPPQMETRIDPKSGVKVIDIEARRFIVTPETVTPEAISEKFYYSQKYARALVRFNQENGPSARGLFDNPPRFAVGDEVFVPPAPYLEARYSSDIPGLKPLETPPITIRTPEPAPRDVKPVTPKITDPVGKPAVPPKDNALPPAPIGGSTSRRNPEPISSSTYVVQGNGEMMYFIARQTLGDGNRWPEIYRLNPQYDPAFPVPGGSRLRLPVSARVAP